MFLVELIYASRADGITGAQMTTIVEEARVANRKRFITGALHFQSGVVIQCLEGEREVVNALYNNIVRDARHKDPVVLAFEQIDCRTFERWNMGYVREGLISPDLYLKYAIGGKFDPFSMRGESAVAFARKLALSLATSGPEIH
ncbi:BLUF domain-containing protein [Roseibium aestuarii]|uniref:BLUF domain-containing protein n=1 Tax=Roseibium aestuarii TaxID=2600299 RepID=A0ABW4JTS8_9HYPH|nr:BLUF domain-containing protein [Roseibium aestuarii]